MKIVYLIVASLSLITFTNSNLEAQDPLFPNSVVSNDIDFILGSDEDEFSSLTFIGLDDKEMPSSISNELFDEDTYVFEATFSDGETIEIWCHSTFPTQEDAQEYADKVCPRLGKLPTFQRNMLDHVVVHFGDAGAFAEIEGQFIILYSDNIDARISTNDLEETIFHESVHASYQFMYQNDNIWTGAQSSDPTFVTNYAQDNPQVEDMAESALFAYTFLAHPGRLSEEIENWLEENIPNRLDFFRYIYQFNSTTTDEYPEINIISYPNPTTNKVYLVLDQINDKDLISIFNSSGNLMLSLDAKSGQNIIDLESLPNGVYIISIPGYRRTRLIKQ